MLVIDHIKTRCLCNGMIDCLFQDATVEMIRSFQEVENIYVSAMREIITKLENLNDELTITINRSPIHQIKARIKTPKSIAEKLIRRGFELNIRSARENLNDIAGIRAICVYIDDIYNIANLLTSQDDIRLLRRTDYIQNPKTNGYRSLHLVVTVPVFLSKRIESIKVEIQLRTIAMDFWASLEHDLVYKLATDKTDDAVRELKDCADIITKTDLRMQKLHNMIDAAQKSTPGERINKPFIMD